MVPFPDDDHRPHGSGGVLSVSVAVTAVADPVAR